MQIALTNIITNAIEAMGSGKGELKVITKSTEESFVLQIEDNGCGISTENLENIFKPYFSKKQGGLGLGLSVTYEILRSSYIRVKVKSVEGQGTRFSLLFDKNEPFARDLKRFGSFME